MIKKGVFKMNGITIFGICIALIGTGTIFWGTTLYPINLLDSEFMSLFVGGLVLISIGVALMSGVSPILKISIIWVTAILTLVYIYGFEMDLIVKLISFVPIIGLVIWLTTKFLK